MSVFEKQAKLGRDLFELNTSTFQRLIELQTEGVQKYFETNQTFAQKLPEITDLTSFMELQREYGETVWQNAQASMQARGDIVREAVERAGTLMREGFSTEAAA